MPPLATHVDPASTSFTAPGARRALAGFFVTGLLLAFLGAIILSWGYHLSNDYETIGAYFLSSCVGILVSIRAGLALFRRWNPGTVLVIGCGIACAALLYLAAVGPPAPAWTRMVGIFFVGFAAGLLHAAIFLCISPMYKHDPVATVNLAGTLFGLGCLTVTLLISGAYYIYSVPSMLILLAVIPGFFAIFYKRSRFADSSFQTNRPLRDVLNDIRSPSAVFLALLLFFQFGNEWSIAGWLPLFLVQRLGISPEKSLLLLALYWICLLVGRIVAQTLVTHVSHTRILVVSVTAAALGCFILSFTDNRFGASIGILLIGIGFAPIYPLVVEKIGDRFPGYHPGFYNGIFSFAFAGGLLAPCSLGWFADMWDIRAVMVLPLFGTLMVLLLLLAIWVESRLPAQRNSSEAEPAGPS